MASYVRRTSLEPVSSHKTEKENKVYTEGHHCGLEVFIGEWSAERCSAETDRKAIIPLINIVKVLADARCFFI